MSAVAVFVGAVVSVMPLLLTGRSSVFRIWPRWRIRALATVGVLIFGVLVILSFVTNAEPPGGVSHGAWGDRTDREFFAGWLVFLAAIVTLNLRRELRFHRRND